MVEIGIKIAMGEEGTTTTEVVIGIIGLIIGITVGPKIGTITEMVVGTTIDPSTEGKTVVKGMVIGTRTVADPGIEIEIGGIGVASEKVPNPEAVVDPKIDTKTEGRVEMILEIETGLNLDVDPLLVSVLTETEVGAIDTMNMTILQENVLMIQQVEIQVMSKGLL